MDSAIKKHYYKAMGAGLISLFLIAATILTGDFLASSDAITVYVAVNGDDANSGTIELPVKTFTRAREIIRTNNQPGSKVLVRGGDYEFSSTLSFTSDDSGASGLPNMWANFPGETVNIYGSVQPTVLQTGPTTYAADLSGTPAENGSFEFVFRSDQRLTPARLPNWNTPNFGQRDPYLGSYFYAAQDQAGVRNVLKYRPENAAAINELAGQSGFSVYIDNHEGLWHWRYKRTVTAINTATRELTLDQNLPSNIIAGDPFWIEGSSTLLTDNEFYFDSATKVLTIQLSTALSPGERLSVPVVNDLVTTRASHFTWHGFRMSEYNSRAFTVDHTADRVTFRNNEVVNGKNGFMTEYWPATNLLIDGNHFHQLERGIAVGVFGGQFVKTLTPNGNIIRNNTVQNIDIYGGAVGTSILVDKEQVGVEVSDNTISRVSRHGIIFEGNDHKILRNNISLWGQLRVDAAAINTGARTFIRQGTLIEGNYIFKQGSYVQRGYADWELTNDTAAPNYNGIPIGIMLDDYARNITVRNNVVHNVNGACISNHGGSHNKYIGNFLVDCHTGIYSDEPNLASAFWAPIYSAAYNEIQAMAGNGYDTDLYTTRYPNLSDVTENPGQGEVMKNVHFEKNLFVGNHYPHKVHRGDVTSFSGTGNVVRNKLNRSFLVTYEAPNSGTYSDINLVTWKGFGLDADLVEMSVNDSLFSNVATFTLSPSSIAVASGIAQLSIASAGVKAPSVPTPTVAAVTLETSAPVLSIDAALNTDPYGYQLSKVEYQLRRLEGSAIATATDWQELPYLQGDVAITDPIDGGYYVVCLRSQLDVINSLNPETGYVSSEGCTEAVLYQASRTPPTDGDPDPVPEDAPSDTPPTSGTSSDPSPPSTGAKSNNNAGTPSSSSTANPATDSAEVGEQPSPASADPVTENVINKGFEAAAEAIVENTQLPDTLESQQKVEDGLRIGTIIILSGVVGVAIWQLMKAAITLARPKESI